jgi:hypothetical protein
LRSNSKPPVVLVGCRVEQYAVRPRSVRFAGHGQLFRGGRELGPVPKLALGRSREGEVLLLLCNAQWTVEFASGGYSTLRAAKQRTERLYPGISKVWVRTGYTKRQARRALERSGANQRCSICSKLWFEVEKMVEIRKAKLTICGTCVRELHALVSADNNHPSG